MGGTRNGRSGGAYGQSDRPGARKPEFECGVRQPGWRHIAESRGMELRSPGHSRQIVRHARCPVLLVKRDSHQKQVLAATDFSDPSLPAVAAAAEESQIGGSQLILMHSLDLIQTFTSEGMTGTIYPADFLSQGDLEVLTKQVRQHLHEALQKYSVQGSTRVSHGPAGWAIVQMAEQLDAELIVVGTLGRTGLARLFLGSVCEFVIRHAPCLVLAVRLQDL